MFVSTELEFRRMSGGAHGNVSNSERLRSSGCGEDVSTSGRVEDQRSHSEVKDVPLERRRLGFVLTGLVFTEL